MVGLEDHVQNEIEELSEEIQDIIDSVFDFFNSINVDDTGNWSYRRPPNILERAQEYEIWYNRALPLISDFLPDRVSDFQEQYEKASKIIVWDVEHILSLEAKGPRHLRERVTTSLFIQRNLLLSVPERAKAEELRAKTRVSRSMVSEELERAEELLSSGDIRSSGVLAGVALERHLLTMCETSEEELDFEYMDGISSLAQTLSNNSVIIDDDERLLSYLGGIRNKCSHANEEDPTESEVNRLLNETNEFVRRTPE